VTQGRSQPTTPAASAAHRLLDGRLKLRHLTLVCALADQGTMLRAAEHLHVTQPVLTRGLRELEELLGARLFDRGPKGVTPTAVGLTFVGHARAVLGQIGQAGTDVDDLVHARSGRVRVGTHLAGASLLLPKAIAQLKRGSPGITVLVREATPDVLGNELRAGDLDLVVSRLQPATADPRLRSEQLYREPIALVTRPAHPVQHRHGQDLRPPELTDLLAYPWVLPVQQTDLRHQLEDMLAEAGLPLPADRVECSSMMITRYLLVETDAVAVLPLLVAEHDEKLSVLPVRLPSLRHPVGLIRVADRWVSPAVHLLIGELRAVGQEIGALPES
jgi:DNA-binding transcriptional LysR family regulator